MGADVKRLAVFAVRKTAKGTVWIRAGVAFENRDGSISITLDVLPLDGRLHCREDSTAALGADE